MVSQDNDAKKAGKRQAQKGRGKNPSRRVAANMLAAILRGKTLDEARDRLRDLTPSDRNLADAMVLTALRHFGTLEKIIRSYVKKMPPRASPARALLFIGAAQLLRMNVPPHAAIDETVAATGRREQPYRGLINAVLRNMARAQQAGELPVFDAKDNLPDWLRDNWSAAYGDDAVAHIAAALAQPPTLDLCFKTPAGAAAWQSDNADKVKSDKATPTHLRLAESTDVTKLPGFAAGDFWVQNAAAGTPALMLNKALPSAANVLDICAAPGGKTLQLAAHGHQVTALDISENRLKKLGDNLRRTALTAEIICAEAQDWLAGTARKFDAILLDAPCTATGTLRRHPDLLRHRTGGDMEKLIALQAALLKVAIGRLKAGGFLAYGVCAIQPQEGKMQIEALLAAHTDIALCEEALFLPHADAGDDGFYAALLNKPTESSE